MLIQTSVPAINISLPTSTVCHGCILYSTREAARHACFWSAFCKRICYAIPMRRWVGKKKKNGLILGSTILDWRAIKDWNVTDDRRMLVSIQAHFEPTDIHSATKNSKSIFGVTQNLPCCMSCHPSLHPPTLSLPFLQTCSAEKVWGFALFASVKAQGFPTAPSRSFPVANQHWKGFASRKKPAIKHHFRGGRIPVSL